LRGGDARPPRDPKPRDGFAHVVVISAGVALYLATLWLGVVVIGDTLGRSAVMAALIVAIAGVGYVFTHQPTRPGGS
jgi:hypothetical protein